MASKSRDADTIRELAQKRYNRARLEYESVNQKCVEQMKRLDELKFEIWNSFGHFLDTFEKIKNRPELTGEVQAEKIQLTAVELDELRVQTTKIKDAAITVTGAAVGAAAATSSATIVLGGIGLSAFTVMGVGQAVVTTASFASVNIALYGVGAVFWPAAVIAAAATAVGALFSHVHGSKKIIEAHEIEEQVDEACVSYKTACDFLRRLQVCAENTLKATESLYAFYKQQLQCLDRVVEEKDNYQEFTAEERYLLEAVTIFVALLKRISQTALLVSKENNNSPEMHSNMAEEEVVPEINDLELNNTLAVCNDRFESTKKELEKWSAREENVSKTIEYEDVVLSNETQLQNVFENKNIIIDKAFSIRNKTLRCKNCKVRFETNTPSDILCTDTSINFENCVFETGNERFIKFVCEGKCKILLADCRFENCAFNHDGFLIVKRGCEFEMKNSHFDKCCNLFVEFYDITGAKISNCQFDNHTNKCIQVITCGHEGKHGVILENCTFRKITCDKEYCEDGREKNAIISADYSHVQLINCVFSDSSITAYKADALNEKITFEGCEFKNIHVGEKKKGYDNKTYYEDKAIDIPGGLCTFENCIFYDVSNLLVGSIGDCMNAISRVERCTFTKCRGQYHFSAMELLGCTFEECSAYAPGTEKSSYDDPFSISAILGRVFENTPKSMIYLGGMAQKGNRRCLSEIGSCRFVKCTAKDYFVEPTNPMYRKEICVSINNNIFEQCTTQTGEMYTLEFLEFGKKKPYVLATESGNKVIC